MWIVIALDLVVPIWREQHRIWIEWGWIWIGIASYLDCVAFGSGLKGGWMWIELARSGLNWFRSGLGCVGSGLKGVESTLELVGFGLDWF